MSAWNEWEIMWRQVAVAGRVVDESDKPVAGVEVTLTMLAKKRPSRSDRTGRDQQEVDEPYDRSVTKPDGIFFFLDTPPGEYTVKCVDGRSGLQDKKTVSVSREQDEAVQTAIRQSDVPALVSFFKKAAVTKQLAVADLKLRKAEGRSQ